jgi:hypothetical protein
LFARADHPLGWGYPQVEGFDEETRLYTMTSAQGRAHGYSLLAVECADETERGLVLSALAANNFYGRASAEQYAQGLLGEWFGGHFDYVGEVTGADAAVTGPNHQRFVCFGDNRNFAIFTAAEVLEIIDKADGDAATPSLGTRINPLLRKLLLPVVIVKVGALALLLRRRKSKRRRKRRH